jgi:hypothetical protein
MLFKKNQKPSTGHNFAQFEKFALINGENLTIKGGTGWLWKFRRRLPNDDSDCF